MHFLKSDYLAGKTGSRERSSSREEVLGGPDKQDPGQAGGRGKREARAGRVGSKTKTETAGRCLPGLPANLQDSSRPAWRVLPLHVRGSWGTGTGTLAGPQLAPRPTGTLSTPWRLLQVPRPGQGLGPWPPILEM